MAKKQKAYSVPRQGETSQAENFLHNALVHITGAMGLLISLSVFTATYDTAQVKLTLLHMGSFLLIALWTSLQLIRRKNPFNKQNLPLLLPVLLYIGWNVLCYIFAPFHMDGAEEFIRFVMYGFITLLAATEFTLDDVKSVTKWFLAAIWISFLYAVVQILDGFFPGIDPMPWRGFFTKRIFSTHANPNFFGDFVIFASCLLGGVYLAERKKKYLALILVGLVALFFTESKGAWLSYSVVAALGICLYTNCCLPSWKKHLKKINIFMCVVLLGIGILVSIYTVKRFQSVSFRTHTWLGTFEMIKHHPVIGVGTGNFKTVYSAYRRPQIFYIESAHNVETQHAENELLEQWAVSGTVGLAIFLWMMFFLFTLAWHTLRKNQENSPFKYYLLGYTLALTGMFVHSWVDVSLRFASSGFFFALFMGILIALCHPVSRQNKNPSDFTSKNWLLWPLRLLIVGGMCVVSVNLMHRFYEMTATLQAKSIGEILLLTMAWVVFAFCILGTCVLLWQAQRRIRCATALIPFILLLPLEFVAYCPFQANHLYNLGVVLNNQGNAEGALGFFTGAISLNPLQTEYYQFRANLLSTTFDLTKRFSPIRGDKKESADDYTRALKDYDIVTHRSPNHPLLHHNRGQLYYRMALTKNEQATRAHSDTEYELFKQAALTNMAKAKTAFERSLLTDPVNPDTYMYLTQISLLENNIDQAQAWLDRFREGPAGVTEKEFLLRHQNYPPANALQAQINARRLQNNKKRQ